MAKIRLKNVFTLTTILFISLFSFTACQPEMEIEKIDVAINIDGSIIEVQTEVGTTVQTILTNQDIEISQLDRISPSLSTVLTQNEIIQVTRVVEEFETEEIILPFERQTVRNENLPESQTILIQPGINGTRQITYRKIFENGELTSKTEINRVDLVISRPEIVMVGVQTPFSPVNISGKIAYITAGNAWVMEDTTANRTPVVTNGRLDGRVLSLSRDGDWLLFTQSSEEQDQINELFVINLEDPEAEPVSLQIFNIIHFADWAPGFSLSVAYSTVEPRTIAPGWQANNDLSIATLGADGRRLKTEEIIESNSGGIYGWWGTTYQYSPNGSSLAYARPDSIGLVNFEDKMLEPLVSIIPFQTNSEWAWISPVSWSQESRFLFFVSHQEDNLNGNSEASPFFDLEAVQIDNKQKFRSSKNVGMFAFPSVSPLLINNQQKVAFLKAVFAENSESSRYRLQIMDRDGSNLVSLFPQADSPGIEPQPLFWSPCENSSLADCSLGFVYQGNIWFFNLENNSPTQITGDGLISKIDWQ